MGSCVTGSDTTKYNGCHIFYITSRRITCWKVLINGLAYSVQNIFHCILLQKQPQGLTNTWHIMIRFIYHVLAESQGNHVSWRICSLWVFTMGVQSHSKIHLNRNKKCIWEMRVRNKKWHKAAQACVIQYENKWKQREQEYFKVYLLLKSTNVQIHKRVIKFSILRFWKNCLDLGNPFGRSIRNLAHAIVVANAQLLLPEILLFM